MPLVVICGKADPNPMHAFSKASPIIVSGTYSYESIARIAALGILRKTTVAEYILNV